MDGGKEDVAVLKLFYPVGFLSLKPRMPLSDRPPSQNDRLLEDKNFRATPASHPSPKKLLQGKPYAFNCQVD